MTRERGGFTSSERHDEDNCVFFATYDYCQDQFGVELTRKDFSAFLQRKVKTADGSGIRVPDIPHATDQILKPYRLAVSAILFQIGAREHYSKQVSPLNLPFWLRVQGFLHDARAVETQFWDLPFSALLTGGCGVDHVEYVKDVSNFERVLDKVGGDKGRIPFGFKLG
jgi:hypothetical protein